MTVLRVINKVSKGVLEVMLGNNKKFPVNVDSIAVGKRVLEENESFKVICFNFESGKGLEKHTHNGFASIMVWDGRVNIEFTNGEKFTLNKGDILGFDARIEHSILADGLTKVILTIGK